MDRAIRALSTGAALPAEDSGLLADYLEAHTSASIGIDPPKGWLIIDMAAIDAARCVLDDRSSAPNDLVRAAEALRGGTQFPAESSAKLAVLLEKHRALEWPDNAPEQWQKVDHAAQAITQAIIRGLQ